MSPLPYARGRKGDIMSYYRYAIEEPLPNGESSYHRSLTPLPKNDLSTRGFFSYHLYTSEKDDSSTWNVISIGHERRWSNKRHSLRRGRFILHYIVSGKGTCFGNPIYEGQFFFVRPWEMTQFESDPHKPLEFYYIGISGPGTEEIMQDVGFTSLSSCIQLCPFIEQIPSLFNDYLHVQHSKCDTDYLLRGFFFSLIARHKALNENEKVASSENTYYYYKQALLYIQEYLTKGISPSGVAEYLHISPSYLRAIFARYCRFSLRELLIRKRIEFAANLLAFENESVISAGTKAGYADYTLFYKMFKKYMGVSPKAYRLQHGQQHTATKDRAESLSPVLLGDEQISLEKETSRDV